MKKGCLGRFVVFLLVVGCAGLGYEDYSLYQDKVGLQSQLAAANAKLDQMRTDGQISHPGSAGKPGAVQPAEDAWLNQAQQHATKAAEALESGDFPTVGRESSEAWQELRKAPDKMSTDTQNRYDAVKGQLLGIQKQVGKVKDEATSAWHDLTGG